MKPGYIPSARALHLGRFTESDYRARHRADTWHRLRTYGHSLLTGALAAVRSLNQALMSLRASKPVHMPALPAPDMLTVVDQMLRHAPSRHRHGRRLAHTGTHRLERLNSLDNHNYLAAMRARLLFVLKEDLYVTRYAAI